ncbi:MAG: ATP-binding protein [Dehalococcoidia bacterium]
MSGEERVTTIRASAQLITILGRELIDENAVAVLELVKNGYDADATLVDVKIEFIRDPERTQVIVHDNGHGMSDEDIFEKWMVAGYSAKKEQLVRQEVSPRGRLPLGQMGIGRFATARLGRKLFVVTRKAGHPEVFFKIDWDAYSGNATVSDVEIVVTKREPQIFTGDNTGTRVAMVGAVDPWTESDLEAVHRKLLRLRSPIHELPDFDISFTCSDRPELSRVEPERIIDNYHFQLTAKIDDHGRALLTWKNRLTGEGSGDPEEVDLWAKKRKKQRLGLDGTRNPECGPFELEFRAWRMTQALLKQTNIPDKRFVEELSGVSVFRDQFRILPYGEPGNDWLGLDMRRVNNATSRFSNNQLIGIVDIETKANEDLRDQANRLGLQHNMAYWDFRDLVLEALDELESRTVMKAAKERERARRGAEAVLERPGSAPVGGQPAAFPERHVEPKEPQGDTAAVPSPPVAAQPPAGHLGQLLREAGLAEPEQPIRLAPQQPRSRRSEVAELDLVLDQLLRVSNRISDNTARSHLARAREAVERAKDKLTR